EALAPGARLRVQAVPWPRPGATPTLVLLRGGAPSDDAELRRRLAPRVSELASASGLARLERGGYLVVDVEGSPSEGPPGGPGERLHIGALALSPDRDSRMLTP
ncbi:MAG: hypothetical protein IT385_12605, partial [Deltaproteobacteria bacterium]|nr:hypothetical protein [Deltaproteobacteria bacterium]